MTAQCQVGDFIQYSPEQDWRSESHAWKIYEVVHTHSEPYIGAMDCNGEVFVLDSRVYKLATGPEVALMRLNRAARELEVQ